jgi:hypothetical protein
MPLGKEIVNSLCADRESYPPCYKAGCETEAGQKEAFEQERVCCLRRPSQRLDSHRPLSQDPVAIAHRWANEAMPVRREGCFTVADPRSARRVDAAARKKK